MEKKDSYKMIASDACDLLTGIAVVIAVSPSAHDADLEKALVKMLKNEIDKVPGLLMRYNAMAGDADE